MTGRLGMAAGVLAGRRVAAADVSAGGAAAQVQPPPLRLLALRAARAARRRGIDARRGHRRAPRLMASPSWCPAPGGDDAATVLVAQRADRGGVEGEEGTVLDLESEPDRGEGAQEVTVR